MVGRALIARDDAFGPYDFSLPSSEQAGASAD
jgi:hypothetical protein